MKNKIKKIKKIKKMNITESVLDFIKYHNAFTIGLIFVFAIGGTIFASEDVRNTVVGEKIVEEQGIDNSQLLAADLSNFDLAMTIKKVEQDDLNYYVDYNFNTLAVKDNVWQSLLQESLLTVSKSALGERDLGLYVQKELGEVADFKIKCLKDVQLAEKEKEETKIVQTTEYTGLIGLVLDVKNNVFPGYEPVVEPTITVFEPKPTDTTVQQQPTPEPQPEADHPLDEAPAPAPEPEAPVVEEPVVEPQPEADHPLDEAPAPTPEPQPEADHPLDEAPAPTG